MQTISAVHYQAMHNSGLNTCCSWRTAVRKHAPPRTLISSRETRLSVFERVETIWFGNCRPEPGCLRRTSSSFKNETLLQKGQRGNSLPSHEGRELAGDSVLSSIFSPGKTLRPAACGSCGYRI